jgi:EAL domain-containing protein (putative c-di-GMP-specific phosphodiesterase class I)
MINRVKIDRNFISALPQSQPDIDLLAGLTDLTHRLGIQVAAGGVETQDQDVVVRRLGCDLVQGNLYASASSAEDCITWLHQWKAA